MLAVLPAAIAAKIIGLFTSKLAVDPLTVMIFGAVVLAIFLLNALAE
jgi:hypothetical protein